MGPVGNYYRLNMLWGDSMYNLFWAKLPGDYRAAKNTTKKIEGKKSLIKGQMLQAVHFWAYLKAKFPRIQRFHG